LFLPGSLPSYCRVNKKSQQLLAFLVLAVLE
jgi:hypothetical protein